jgi:hypothetical protein
MKTVLLKTATHIHALPGTVSVSDAECARLCALGVAEPVAEPVKEVEAEPVKEAPKRTRKKAVK